ncbi:DNA-directed RNA polymerase subunit K [Nanoarchaeota archaeon]
MEKEAFTKYEIARILGARALQLSMNAPMLLAISKEKLEDINFDPLKIAELEFNSGILPITVKRPLPGRLDGEEDDEEEDEIVVETAVVEKELSGTEKAKSVEKESAELEEERSEEANA